MKLTLVAATLSTVLLATGCNVKLPGGARFPGSGGGGGSNAGGGSSASGAEPAKGPSPDAAPSQPVGQLAPYYASLTLDVLYTRIAKEREDQIYDHAKTDVGRDALWKNPNPDPTWIKEWRQKDWTNASDNAEAMTQAAFNRAWEASCSAEFAATSKAHAEVAARFAPELARVDGLTNYYERMAGYAALAAQVEEAMTAASLPIDKDPSGPIGMRITVLEHAIAFHNQSRHAFVAFPTAQFPTADRIRKAGRDRTDDAGFERARYCARVSDSGGITTTPFASIWSEGHMSARRVAWPTITGDERANRTRADALVAALQPRLETARELRVEAVSKDQGFSPPAEEPKLGGFYDYKVKAIKGDLVTVARDDWSSYDYACKTTNKIDRITDSGKLIYQLRCKTGRREWKVEAKVTFAELPPGVTLAVGDVLEFAADVEADAKKQVTNTPAKQVTTRALTLTGRHLRQVTRDGKRVW
ncbi:MAG: hypothetical protein R3B06_24765 [Kofleriaceae bacterium]